jgi:iron(III) transport system substrate-binding protein
MPWILGRVFRTLAATCVAATALSLVACGSSSSSATGVNKSAPQTASSSSVAGQTITVYSGQHEQTVQSLVTDFEKRSGVHVKVRSGDEAELAGQLLQEGSASPADVFFAENPPALTTLQEAHLLGHVDSATLASVPSEVSSPQGDWVGVSARTSALAVSNRYTGTVPTSVLALADPQYKGKIGFAPGETDFAPIVTKVIKAAGETAAKAWLVGLKNNAKTYADNESLIAAVNRNEVSMGILDHYYWYRLRDEVGATKIACKIVHFAPNDPGALVDVSGAAPTAHAKHPAAAQAFLAYLVSAPAQQIIATSESYEYPLRPGVTSQKGLQPLSSIGTLASVAELGDGKQALSLLQNVSLL